MFLQLPLHIQKQQQPQQQQLQYQGTFNTPTPQQIQIHFPHNFQKNNQMFTLPNFPLFQNNLHLFANPNLSLNMNMNMNMNTNANFNFENQGRIFQNAPPCLIPFDAVTEKKIKREELVVLYPLQKQNQMTNTYHDQNKHLTNRSSIELAVQRDFDSSNHLTSSQVFNQNYNSILYNIAHFRPLEAPCNKSFREVEVISSFSQLNRDNTNSESPAYQNAAENFSPTSSSKKLALPIVALPTKEDIRALKRKILGEAGDLERSIILQIQQVSKQNSAKAFLKAYKKFALSELGYLYAYDISENKYYYKLCSEQPIVRVSNPTKKQIEGFSRKFKKFLNGKQFNNTTLKNVVRNKLYGKLFDDFLQTHAAEWLRLSKTKNKDDLKVLIQYLRLCTHNHDYLVFLRDHDKTKQTKDIDNSFIHNL